MIEYKIFGSLRNTMGDAVVKVSPGVSREAERLGACFNVGEDKGYASLIMLRQSNGMSEIVHFQPSHIKFEDRARDYCTRCIYELSADDFGKIANSFRNFFQVLPKMELYDKADYNASPIQLSDMAFESPVLSECEMMLLGHILLAKERSARLFVKIGNKQNLKGGAYFENGVLTSSKLQSLLKVLDFLPTSVRTEYSFAFSVDSGIAKHIENVDVVFYQDELHDWNLETQQVVSVDWCGDGIVSSECEAAITAQKNFKKKLFDEVTDFEHLTDLSKSWGKPERIEKVLERIVVDNSIDYLVGIKVLSDIISAYKSDIDNLINARRTVVDKVRLLKSPCFSIRIADMKVDSWEGLSEVYDALSKYYEKDLNGYLREILKNNKPLDWKYSYVLESLCEKIIGTFGDDVKSEIRRKYLKENLLEDRYKIFYSNGYTKDEWECLLKDKSSANIAIEKLLLQKSPSVDMFGSSYEAILKKYVDYKYDNGFGINSEALVNVIAKCSDSVAGYIFEKYCTTSNLSECLKSFERRVTDRVKQKSVEVCLAAIGEEYRLSKVFDLVVQMQNLKLDGLLAEKFDESKLKKLRDADVLMPLEKINNEKIRKIISDRVEQIRIAKLPEERDVVMYCHKEPKKLSAIGNAEDIRLILNGKQGDAALGISKVYEFNKAAGVDTFGKHETVFHPLESFWEKVFSEVVDFMKNYGSGQCFEYKWVRMSEANEAQFDVVGELLDVALRNTKNIDGNDWRKVLAGFRKFVIGRSGDNSKVNGNEPVRLKIDDDFYKQSVKLSKAVASFNKSERGKAEPIRFSDYIEIDSKQMSGKKNALVASGSVFVLLLIVFGSFWLMIIKTERIPKTYNEIIGYGCDYGFDSVVSNPMLALSKLLPDTLYGDSAEVKNIYVRHLYVDSIIVGKPLLPFLRSFIKEEQPDYRYENDTLAYSVMYCNLDSLWKFDSMYCLHGKSEEIYLICKSLKTSSSKEKVVEKVTDSLGNVTERISYRTIKGKHLVSDTISINKEKPLLRHFIDKDTLFAADTVFYCDSIMFLKSEMKGSNLGKLYFEAIRRLDSLSNNKDVAY